MSSEMPWVKLYTEMLDDPKIGPLDERRKWRFTEACLLAGECDCSGYLVSGEKALTLADIAWRIRSTVEQIQPDYDALMALGVIVWDEERKAYYLPNFEKRQGRPQHEKRQQWREWQDKHRAKDVRPDKENVSPDTGMSQAPRGEERSLEERRKEEEERDTPPPTVDSSLISSTEKGAMIIRLLKAAYNHVPERYENHLQRDAYLAVFEALNGELEDVMNKGIAKGVRTRGDLLSWLQGCARASAAKAGKAKAKGQEKPKKVYR